MARGNILLIEPDRVLSEILVKSLESRGRSVRQVFGAQEAVIAADQNQPDLIICELQLVDHSGIEFLYEFRSYTDWQSVPVIIFSSVPPIEFSGSRQGLMVELGVIKYLYKPSTTVIQLMREVDQILGSIKV